MVPDKCSTVCERTKTLTKFVRRHGSRLLVRACRAAHTDGLFSRIVWGQVLLYAYILLLFIVWCSSTAGMHDCTAPERFSCSFPYYPWLFPLQKLMEQSLVHDMSIINAGVVYRRPISDSVILMINDCVPYYIYCMELIV